MYVADDVLLIDTSREGVEIKLKLWTNTVESQKLKISWAKTKYMKCNFNWGHKERGPFYLYGES